MAPGYFQGPTNRARGIFQKIPTAWINHVADQAQHGLLSIVEGGVQDGGNRPLGIHQVQAQSLKEVIKLLLHRQGSGRHQHGIEMAIDPFRQGGAHFQGTARDTDHLVVAPVDFNPPHRILFQLFAGAFQESIGDTLKPTRIGLQLGLFGDQRRFFFILTRRYGP